MRKLVVLFLFLLSQRAWGSVLSDAAGALSPGSWTTISTIQPQGTFSACDDVDVPIISFTDDVTWDSFGRSAYFMGQGHSSCDPKFVRYTESTNTFSILPSTPDDGKHGFDHNVIDVFHRYFYRRIYGLNQVKRFSLASQTWISDIPPMSLGYVQIAIGLDWFPERNSLVAYSGNSGSVPSNGRLIEWVNGAASWTVLSDSIDMGTPNACYHNVAKYNPVHKFIWFGGGNCTSRMWRLDLNGIVTQLSTAPINIGVSPTQSKITVDPISGVFVVASYTGAFWQYDPLTDAWTQLPNFQISNINNFDKFAVTNIPDLGVSMWWDCSQSAIGTNGCVVRLYKHNAGQKTFSQKCGLAGNINCFGFDASSVLKYNWPTGTPCDAALAGQTLYSICGNKASCTGNSLATVQNAQCYFPVIDTTTKNSGAGSLKIATPSQSGAGVGGYFEELLFPNLGSPWRYIAPGSPNGNVLWFQWYQRFDTTMINQDFNCKDPQSGVPEPCGGYKTAILFGNPPNGGSSSSIEVTSNNGWERGVPQMYGIQGSDDYGVQDIRTCVYAGSGYNTRPNYPEPPCVRYAADRFIEFTTRIEGFPGYPTGTNRVMQWMDGQLIVDYKFAKIDFGGSSGNGLGSFELLPYHTKKDPAQVHPTAFTWYDDVVVSIQPIPMRVFTGAAPPAPPPPPAAPIKPAYYFKVLRGRS